MGPVAFVGGGVGRVVEADGVVGLELLDGVAEGVEAVELVEPVGGVRMCVFLLFFFDTCREGVGGTYMATPPMRTMPSSRFSFVYTVPQLPPWRSVHALLSFL